MLINILKKSILLLSALGQFCELRFTNEYNIYTGIEAGFRNSYFRMPSFRIGTKFQKHYILENKTFRIPSFKKTVLELINSSKL